ncbi:hypothetical protein ACFWH4_34190, partial [Streptomyces sp. NPDC127091]
MGSGGGTATVGFHGAGKAALDSVSEAVAMELEGFGIKVTIVQMGGYRVSFAVLRPSDRGEANRVAAARSVAVVFRRSRTVRPPRVRRGTDVPGDIRCGSFVRSSHAASVRL